jgi:hypothetical protein
MLPDSPRPKKTRLPARLPKKPGALKHGAYASIESLPWEDPAELEQLRREIWQEFEPDGPSEEDCVNTIFVARVRKLRYRLHRKLEAELALDSVDNHVFKLLPPADMLKTKIDLYGYLVNQPRDQRIGAARDDYQRLLSFSTRLYLDHSARIVRMELSCLPQLYRDHLNEIVPEANFGETERWLIALRREVDHVLLPQIRERRPDAEGYREAAAKFLTPARMLEDVETEKRIDAQSDRALQRLFWLKAQKKLDREAKQKLVQGKLTERAALS